MARMNTGPHGFGRKVKMAIGRLFRSTKVSLELEYRKKNCVRPEEYGKRPCFSYCQWCGKKMVYAGYGYTPTNGLVHENFCLWRLDEEIWRRYGEWPGCVDDYERIAGIKRGRNWKNVARLIQRLGPEQIPLRGFTVER